MVSWSHSDDAANSISKYIVQVDSHPPYHVSAENTIAHNMIMDLSDFCGVINVTAVDMCGQVSNASITLVEEYTIHTSTQQLPTTTTTVALPTTQELLGNLFFLKT